VVVGSDCWSRWLLDRRDAGDEIQRQATLDHLAPVRDRVLDAAGPLEGATLLDVGCGDGLIGLRALELVGPDGTVARGELHCTASATTRTASRRRCAPRRRR
jgi:precorrin-6B methylase 2